MLTAATKEVIKRGAMYTVLGGLLIALSTPLQLLGATDLIDSRWQIAIDRCHWLLRLPLPFPNRDPTYTFLHFANVR